MNEANGIKAAIGSDALSPVYNLKTQSIFGSVGLNLGMQVDFGKKHTLELLSKIPLLENDVVSYNSKTPNQQGYTKLSRGK